MKASRNGKNYLYVIIDDEQIKKTDFFAGVTSQNVKKQPTDSVSLNIADILSKVNSPEIIKYVPDDFLTEEYTLADLQHDFPEKWQDIKAAADYCREVYDQYLKDLNAMYSEIYPATKEAAEEQVENYREAEKALRKKEKDGPLCFAKQAVLLMAIDYLMLLFS